MKVTLQIDYKKAFDTEYLSFLKKVGYDGVELLLNGDLENPEKAKKNIEEAGLIVPQTEIVKENIEEGLRVSALFGVKWACLQAEINYDTNLIVKSIPLAKKYGVGIALENPARYSNYIDAFCIWVDAFKSDFIGVCYNPGHTNIIGNDDFGLKKFDFDRIEALKKVGSRIKIAHFNDNNGDVDRKMAPTVPSTPCCIKWKETLDAFAEVGFDGAFSLVLDINFGKYDLDRDYLKFAVNVSNILLGKEVAR